MKCLISLLSLVAVLPAVQGIVFGGPAPTAATLKRALDSALPKPTIAPTNDELKKRQTNLHPETCGWVDGIYSSGVTCPGSRTCMLYTSAASGMAGCCDGANTIDCGWASSCVDAKAYRSEGCGSDCLLNSFIRKCTATTAPYCVTWLYPSNGVHDYGCAANSDSSVSTIFETATDAFGATTSMHLPTVTANAVSTDVPGSTTRKTAKKVAIGLIIGVVVAVLFVLFCVVIGIVFCIKKKKKQRQIAASTQAMAAVHATRPQSQYPPNQQQYPYLPTQQQQQAPVQTQMQQPSPFHPLIDPQSPASATTSYFAHGAHEEKPNAHTSVQEYAMTPISSPSTPAPVYTQPHVVPPPMPVPVVSQYRAPTEAHEVDAISVPHAPNQAGPVHEMGNGK
ncbi:hypothetical protein ST47_g3479 [Ascochyta rabiei]|uniref:Uncharacterized protein n=2 Tax=Didymella rabiei TaxID=5454 RepID=A0A163HJR0_DIDRA|nr:hypothetical protein ST47_g3479 [Ascochyta rabiei]